MKLEILCLTQPSRSEYLKRLRACIGPQLTADVRFTVRMFDPRLFLGVNRQWMIDESKAEYICFIDDDDLVADDYVSTILPLLDGIDYVGFELQCYIDGVPFSHTYHDLRCGGWHNDEKGYYRDISHLNPIRRELALLEPMEGGNAEDHRWADRMRATGKVRTQHMIPRVMYFYYSRSIKNDAEFRWSPP